MFKKCFFPADHMAPVSALPLSRACLAMPMAPAMKNASAIDSTANIPKKRNATTRIFCHPRLPRDPFHLSDKILHRLNILQVLRILNQC